MSSAESVSAARRGHRRMIAAVLAMAFVLIVGFAAWRIWDGLYVQPSEARNALLRLPYEFRFRRIPATDGLKTIIAGSALAHDGTRVNFAILLGHDGANARDLPVLPGAGRQTASRLANATVIVSTPRVTGEHWPSAEIRMDVAIENAIYDQAPLRPRDG